MANDSNVLATWGNKQSMNLNSLLLNNILASQYFKVTLYEKKNYLEVVDEIYYQVFICLSCFQICSCFLGQTFGTMGKRKSKNIRINGNVRRSKLTFLLVKGKHMRDGLGQQKVLDTYSNQGS
jgi:hypothetical protein